MREPSSLELRWRMHSGPRPQLLKVQEQRSHLIRWSMMRNLVTCRKAWYNRYRLGNCWTMQNFQNIKFHRQLCDLPLSAQKMNCSEIPFKREDLEQGKITKAHIAQQSLT